MGFWCGEEGDVWVGSIEGLWRNERAIPANFSVDEDGIGNRFPWKIEEIWKLNKSDLDFNHLQDEIAQITSGLGFNKEYSLLLSYHSYLSDNPDVKNGESTRKRLKISVPHFDNSELIKTFSKTLITNLPKIWKLEDRVVGTDLGFAKFQFVF
ncbi:PREDICTED: uncharacterized protein LOC106341931 [Brassica oleracea var. oleracea]|uniref:uncharacterized protein LOC106341931 n=1 Tax=Brassica oleracea var. oleracea TaxID=109376 RepID=UPI0006A71C9B|nr:PREDICTED: uncharacterized protein LOC106341931 [Brassica oleracea var. oleracea]